jgi:hypothetical protein
LKPGIFEFRVTKYNPALRDRRGAYTRDEWTAFCHIGRAFGGVALTQDAYGRVEDAYVSTAIAFLQDAGVTGLAVVGLENPAAHALPFTEGTVVDLQDVASVVRQVLREEFWCRLEGTDAFVHIGFDYYLFLGVPVACPAAEVTARQLGLFVEPFPSPLSP